MELIIHNRVPDLELVRQAVDEFGAQLGLDETDIMRFNLVMEEAVSNVILYAYPGGGVHEIKISMFSDKGLESKADTLRISVEDTGVEFDPTLKDSPDIDQSLEERKIGGLGIFLVKKYMDTVEYKRVDGRNILIMTKTITK